MGKKPTERERPEPSGKKNSGGARHTSGEAIRVLETMNKQLLARVKDLELKPVGGAKDDGGEASDHEASKESAYFSSMVQDLHGDIDAAYLLKKALETDLASTQKDLAEAQLVRGQLEARVNLLEAKAALADQLRDDVSFVEDEQNKTFRRLKEATSELEKAGKERESLAEQNTRYVSRIKELQTQRFDLEAQVLDLRERLAEMVSLFGAKREVSS